MRAQIRSITMNKRTRRFIRERTDIVDTTISKIFTEEAIDRVRENGLYTVQYALECIFEAYWNTPEEEDVTKAISVKILEE